jgi:pimeloyl-ACP methyl ester carboxylesterase
MGDITSVFVPASDGLRLHARCYGRGAAGTPVVCLPGLTRTVADFETLAGALAQRDRRVFALDYRGRGLSDYDANAVNYNVGVELTDVITVLAALKASRSIFVGTSRGGILTMLLAATYPYAIAGAVLNDIGPVIEREGLLRIKSYVGKMPQPKDYDDAARMLRDLFASQFRKLSGADWLAMAHRGFKEETGRLVPTYDVRLAEGMATIRPDTIIPAMWEQFDCLGAVPLLIIRGALSDLLSPATAAEMVARRIGPTELLEVADQGHAPLLNDVATIEHIASFVDRIP